MHIFSVVLPPPLPPHQCVLLATWKPLPHSLLSGRMGWNALSGMPSQAIYSGVFGHKEVVRGEAPTSLSWNPKPRFPSKGWIELRDAAPSPSFKLE